ncbi:MAG: 50S ribosomal protein L24 [Kiritimatiellia bacterium]|jgi:large subunit ribosomal protein L24|nr:50S ribosomal protein L24 [Kiritimatiellia bacterium]MDD4175205.1 50S ribosomal protein L24 [Kiritimatiellia bacterium]MDD4441016.1 50S ribosomal protein L24 [Kiritimatiellia bacterium]MDX9792315.1 50S ribosomal protein L24 [Kiritimatiellia bacterium]
MMTLPAPGGGRQNGYGLGNSMSVARIKKNDMVIAIAGDNAGKTGKVLRVLPKKGKAVVQGLNMVKKAIRRSQAAPDGGFADREAPIDLSNLMPYDPDTKKGVRIRRVQEGDKTVRKSKASGKNLD